MVWSRLCFNMQVSCVQFSLCWLVAAYVENVIWLHLPWVLFGPSEVTEPRRNLGAQQFFQYIFDPLLNTVVCCEILFLPLLMLLPHLTDIQLSNPYCSSRPMVLIIFPLSVFIKSLKILVTLQSSCLIDITLCWWVTNVFSESRCILAVKAFFHCGSLSGIFLNHSRMGKKGILHMVTGHSQVQFLIHNREGYCHSWHISPPKLSLLNLGSSTISIFICGKFALFFT